MFRSKNSQQHPRVTNIFPQHVRHYQAAVATKRKRKTHQSTKESRRIIDSTRKAGEPSKTGKASAVSIGDSTITAPRTSPRRLVQGSNSPEASTLLTADGSASITRTSPRRLLECSSEEPNKVSVGEPNTTAIKASNNNESGVTMVSHQSDADCDHADFAALRMQDNKAYFAKPFLEKNDTAVRSCAECGITFGASYKVSSKTPVYACKYAHHTQHRCMFALCNPCYANQSLMGKFNEASTGRSRRNNAGLHSGK